MDNNLKEKIIAVTGAAGGIGLAIATSFLDKGVKIAILLDVNEDKGNESVTILKQKYGDNRVVFYKCDVTTDLDVIYQTILSLYNNVDILVNNAGVGDERNIKRQIGINTVAVMEWTMKFYEHMRTDKGGKGGIIINVASIFAHIIEPFVPSYHASKFAVLGFSKSIGHQYNFNRTKVRVVTLCPGLTKTSLVNDNDILVWENNESTLSDYMKYLKMLKCQPAEFIGEGAVEIFERAESGSVWLIADMEPAQKWDV